MRTKVRMLFSECEHSGDLENYCGDIVKCGGRIIESSCDAEQEIGSVIAEVPERFIEKFNETDSFGFVDTYVILNR